jgi:hypothetical protein
MAAKEFNGKIDPELNTRKTSMALP